MSRKRSGTPRSFRVLSLVELLQRFGELIHGVALKCKLEQGIQSDQVHTSFQFIHDFV